MVVINAIIIYLKMRKTILYFILALASLLMFKTTLLYMLYISKPTGEATQDVNYKVVDNIDSSVAAILNSKCPAEMVEVFGNYCPEVSQKCLKWLDDDTSSQANGGIGPMRCAEFEKPSKCLSTTRKIMHFCMGKFEYPGTENSYPRVDINYWQAKEIASQAGFRLCSKEEFNFACEGEEMRPYGYGDGFHRDADACNIDKAWIDYSKFPQSSWNDPDGGLYQAVRSTSNSKCKSSFGVFNINGNVDEILDSEGHKNVILSGGYWSTVRNRCRPSTNSHSKDFSFYQVGFRMCAIYDKVN